MQNLIEKMNNGQLLSNEDLQEVAEWAKTTTDYAAVMKLNEASSKCIKNITRLYPYFRNLLVKIATWDDSIVFGDDYFTYCRGKGEEPIKYKSIGTKNQQRYYDFCQNHSKVEKPQNVSIDDKYEYLMPMMRQEASELKPGNLLKINVDNSGFGALLYRTPNSKKENYIQPGEIVLLLDAVIGDRTDLREGFALKVLYKNQIVFINPVYESNFGKKYKLSYEVIG